MALCLLITSFAPLKVDFQRDWNWIGRHLLNIFVICVAHMVEHAQITEEGNPTHHEYTACLKDNDALHTSFFLNFKSGNIYHSDMDS